MNESMREIVAARIGTIITANPKQIMAAIEYGLEGEFITRWQMKVMACADLGPKWGLFAKAKTLFLVDASGNILPPSDTTKDTE